MLSIIHNDHANMNLLLKLLSKRIQSLEQDEKIDYRLIKTIITYLRTYSDKYHHPMEDLIYEYYLKSHTVSDDIALRLTQEHQAIKKVTIELDELLDMILLDAIVSKDICIEKLRNFVEQQTAHLAYEEQEILPLINNSLFADDWDNIAQQWQPDEYQDPLFGENVSEQYRVLATHIKQE